MYILLLITVLMNNGSQSGPSTTTTQMQFNTIQLCEEAALKLMKSGYPENLEVKTFCFKSGPK